jgi:predicted aldo/keto reductase-like oxidoreductase
MTPSRIECEKVLELLPKPNVIAISILAAGYLKLEEAIEYVKNLPNIKGVAVGVSKEKHANETFKILKEAFKSEPSFKLQPNKR